MANRLEHPYNEGLRMGTSAGFLDFSAIVVLKDRNGVFLKVHASSKQLQIKTRT